MSQTARAMVSAVSLIVIRCSDLAVSKAFYEGIGLDLVAEQHGAGPAHFSCTVGSLVIELYPRAQAVSPMRLGFRVPNVARSVERALRAGGHQVHAPSGSPAYALIEDPDRHRIELHEDFVET